MYIYICICIYIYILHIYIYIYVYWLLNFDFSVLAIAKNTSMFVCFDQGFDNVSVVWSTVKLMLNDVTSPCSFDVTCRCVSHRITFKFSQ